MENIEDFHIDYWGREELSYDFPKKKRSIKKRLGIVAGFVLVLALLPLATFVYSRLSNLHSSQVSSAVTQTAPTIAPTPKGTQSKSNVNQDGVIKGDSYWRISKRDCGTGKYYQSIADQNDNKPLQIGDSVTFNCSL